jgi:hypothetical protein
MSSADTKKLHAAEELPNPDFLDGSRTCDSSQGLNARLKNEPAAARVELVP